MRFSNCGILGVLVAMMMSGCASDKGQTAKGHWETLPPQTGSYISRRVWVDDEGNVTGGASSSNVQTTSGAAIESSQRGSGSHRPAGQ